MIPTYRAPQPERRRLSRQCEAILARLQQGPATNRELSAISLKYTSRLSEIRQAGYVIDLTERNLRTGYTVYALGQRGQLEMGF